MIFDFESPSVSISNFNLQVLISWSLFCEKIKEKILEVLTDVNEVMTISELMTADGLENYSNQKLSVLCHQLVNEHKVVNTKVKKVSYFKIA